MKGSRTFHTYVSLQKAAHESLAHAREDEHGVFYDCLLSILASVFMLEAFINHLGMNTCQDWDKKQWAPLKDKLNFVGEALGYSLHADSKEYQTTCRALAFRDFWVHGRTIISERQYATKKALRPNRALETEWERMCTVLQADAVIQCVEAIVHDLWHAAGQKGDAFVVGSYASATRTWHAIAV
jgi:hypothetical protein